MSQFVKIFFVIILPFISNSLYSQSNTWQRIFGSPRDDYATTAFKTIDGNYLMAGEKAVIDINTGFYISQTYLVKFNIYGNIIWQKYYGDSAFFIYPTSAIEMPGGNILITYVSSNNNDGNILKYNSDGNLIWQKTFSNEITGFFNLSLVDSNETILINGDYNTGSTYLPNLTKLDTNGNLIWTKHCNENYGAIGYYNSDEGYYAVGQTGNYSGFISKRDTSGNLIWRKLKPNPYGNYFFRLYSMVQISKSTYYSIGVLNDIPNHGGLYILKIDSSGNSIFYKTYLKENLYGVYIKKTLKDQYLIAMGDNFDNVGTLVIIDSLGNLIQIKNNLYNPESNVCYYTVSNSIDSGFIITGQYNRKSFDFADFLILKTDKNLNFEPTEIEINNYEVDQYPLKVDVFPNPFNPTLNVKIQLKSKGNIRIALFDISGRKVYSSSNILINTLNMIKIDASNINLSSGMYFVCVKNENTSVIKKVVFLK